MKGSIQAWTSPRVGRTDGRVGSGREREEEHFPGKQKRAVARKAKIITSSGTRFRAFLPTEG